jgi:hypothetical protein
VRVKQGCLRCCPSAIDLRKTSADEALRARAVLLVPTLEERKTRVWNTACARARFVSRNVSNHQNHPVSHWHYWTVRLPIPPSVIASPIKPRGVGGLFFRNLPRRCRQGKLIGRRARWSSALAIDLSKARAPHFLAGWKISGPAPLFLPSLAFRVAPRGDHQGPKAGLLPA